MEKTTMGDVIEGLRILVVDDNPRHLEAARDQLGDKNELVCLDNYEEAIARLRSSSSTEKKFHILLSDLLMPAETPTLGSKGMKFLGHEMPIGLILALRASMADVDGIVVITDTNHHNHPMSAAIDWVRGIHRIGNSWALYDHAPMTDDRRKDWRRALVRLRTCAEADMAIKPPPFVLP